MESFFFQVCFAYSGLENAEFVYKYRDTKGVLHEMKEEVIPMQSQSEGSVDYFITKKKKNKKIKINK